jgi:hypothetical protein
MTIRYVKKEAKPKIRRLNIQPANFVFLIRYSLKKPMMISGLSIYKVWGQVHEQWADS